MAVLSASDLRELRQGAARYLPTVVDNKSATNAVFQAIEDYEVDAHTARPGGSRSSAINSAAGRTITTAHQQIFWGVWARWKASNLGIN